MITDHLSTNDLRTVLDEIFHIRSKWFSLGIQLKMNPDDLEAIKVRHNNDPDACLLDLLTTWLKNLDPKPTWESLASALKSKALGNEQLSERVRQKYLTMCTTPSTGATSAKTVKSFPQPQLQNQTNSKSEVFECPCGKCDLISYLYNGCPKTNSYSYPRLSISGLSDKDREDMVQKLSDDTASIIKSFADLLLSTSKSLKSKNISAEELVEVALSLGAYKSLKNPVPLLGEEERELRETKTIAGVLVVLRRHMSFFNHEILAHIIEHLGDENDKENFIKFESQFKVYCQRKVFEVPPTVLDPHGTERSNCKSFVVVGCEDLFETLQDVKKAQMKIASLLDLRVSAVQLKRIDIGSVILVFSIPVSLSGIFPLDPVTHEMLKSHGYSLFVPPTCATAQEYQPPNIAAQNVRIIIMTVLFVQNL